jgi:hypothetical protein
MLQLFFGKAGIANASLAVECIVTVRHICTPRHSKKIQKQSHHITKLLRTETLANNQLMLYLEKILKPKSFKNEA